MKNTEKPNILLLHSDQHRYDCIGATGHPQLRTPHLDRLIIEGVHFTHAFTPSPICSPARTSLMTGQWPTQHQNINLVGESEAPRATPSDVPTFSRILRDTGYYLGYVGKWHVDDDRVRDPTHKTFGFHDYIPEHEYHAWRRKQGIPAQPFDLSDGLSTLYGTVDTHIAPDQSKIHWLADQTIHMIHRAARENSPFFIRLDPSEPHLPNVVPEPYASMYPATSIKPWPSFPDPLEDKPWIQRQQLRTWGVEDWEWEQWSPIVARYLGEISLMDSEFGRILAVLDQLRLTDNTLVIYTTDHGDMCGGHGMMDKHFVMYDDVTHVPLILRWPARLPAGQMYEGFVSNELDLAATFVDAADEEAPATFSGLSLLDFVSGKQEPRSDILATYHGCQMGLYSQRMIRDRKWKLIWNATERDELYDLAHDQGEIVNKIDDPTCGVERARLSYRLIEWMTATNDPLLNLLTEPQLRY